MTSKKTSEIYQLPISTLRQGVALYCRLLGLRKSTCIALTLLLNSEELLIAMMRFMANIDEERIQEDMDQEDITTICVNVAAELKEAWDKMNSQ